MRSVSSPLRRTEILILTDLRLQLANVYKNPYNLQSQKRRLKWIKPVSYRLC